MTLGHRSSLWAFLGALALLHSSIALADPPPDAKKAEAAQRFDRGLSLFDDGDNAGALAEFKRTYELFPNPVVLYNIGLVYAAMGRPVDAVDALGPAVKAGGLSAAELDRAKKTLADEQARIGRLTVTTTPDGASIDIDNVEVAKTPLTGPLRVSEGNHIVGAVSQGFAPARKEVVVAGNQDVTLHLDLVPTQGKALANLTVHSNVADATVRVDGEAAGKTPLATSLTLVAGHHQVELARPGYSTSRKEVDVGEGATGELDFTLAVDPAALGAEGAELAIEATESGTDLTIDGAHLGPYEAALRLPRGTHHISAVAPGFYPVERDVTLDAGQTNIVRLAYDPTPETRAAYESSAHAHRTWGWISIASGLVIGGAGGAFLVVNKSAKSSAQSDYDKALAIETYGNNNKNTNPPPQHPCALFAPATDGTTDSAATCDAYVAGYSDKLDSAKNRDIIGYVGIGVGGAAVVTGVILLVTGGDPDKYDKPASRSLGNSDGPKFALTPGPGQLGTGFSVTF